MADLKSNIESIREWVVDHKLRTVGCLWLSGITGSIAYNWSRPTMKTSVKIIHASGWQGKIEQGKGEINCPLFFDNPPLVIESVEPATAYVEKEEARKEEQLLTLTHEVAGLARLHAQAFTLAALAGAAVVEYYDHRSGTKAERYANQFFPKDSPHSRKD